MINTVSTRQSVWKIIRLFYILIISLTISITTISTVYAQTDDDLMMTVEDSLKSNSITFYTERDDPCTPLTTGISSTGSGSGRQIVASENVEHILRFFTDKGLSLAAAAGFVGNIYQETGGTFNPAIREGMVVVDSNYKMVDGTGFGLIQWTRPERQNPLQRLANSTGRNITDLDLQLDYIWVELNSGWKSTLSTLNSTPNLTPEAAAIIVHGQSPNIRSAIRAGTDPYIELYKLAPRPGYEVSADTAREVYEKRAVKAKEYYELYKDKIEDGAGVIGVGSSTMQLDDCKSPLANMAANNFGLSSTDCKATGPVHGASGGDGRQLKQAQFESIYGTVAEAMQRQTRVNFNGYGVQVHELVAPCLVAVVEDIKASGSTYRVTEIGGWRASGTGAGKVSAGNGYHDYGVAVDINPKTNGYYPRPGNYYYDMPAEYIRAFNGRGWSWGGDWKSMKDYMHFEFNGVKMPENAI